MIFTVMTANVAGQERMGWNKRALAAYEAFKNTTADIVGFQEFGIANWSLLGKARPELRLIQGVAAGDIVINSCAYNPDKFYLIDSDTFWLSPTGRYEKAWDGVERGVTWLKLRERSTQREILFFNAHLDNKGVLARKKSIPLIFRQMKKLQVSEMETQLPIIFVADSNISIDSPSTLWRDPKKREPYEMLIRAGFTDALKVFHDPRPYTFHAYRGEGYTVDEYGTWDTEWIMVRGLTVRTCSLLKGIYSDHYWMQAMLKL